MPHKGPLRFYDSIIIVTHFKMFNKKTTNAKLYN